MKKILITIIIITILIISSFFIKNILTISYSNTDELIEIKYNKSNTDGDMNEYILDEEEEYYFNFKNKIYSYYDNSFYINDTLILEDIKLINNFSTYNNYIILLFNYLNEERSGFIIYNMDSLEYEIIDILNNMYMNFNYGLPIFKSDGIELTLTIVNNDKIIKNNNYYNICDVSDEEIDYVLKDIIYYYDKEIKSFTSVVDISLLPLNSYIELNNYCN